MTLNPSLQAVYNNLKHSFSLTLEDFKTFEKILKLKSFKKGEIILKKGEINDYLSFTVSGVVHQYIFIEDQSFTIDVKVSGMYFNALKSYVEGSPSMEIHEAVTDVELVYFSKKDFESLFQNNHTYCNIYLKSLEFKFLERENRSFILQHTSASKRFSLFMKMNSNANQFLLEVPQKLLASYLALTPETFSKVKKAYFQK